MQFLLKFPQTLIINIIVIIVLPHISLTWDLSVLKISPTYYASSVAVYKNRVFLALPRSSCFNNLTNPTLIEAPWFNEGKYGLFRKKMYPHYKEQKWGSCKDHQDVVSIDLDPKKAKLWVLDRGNRKCLPKIVIYNLHYNTIGQSCKLSDDLIIGEKLSVLVVDPIEDNIGKKAYIGGLDNHILIFSLRGLKLWKIQVLNPVDLNLSISTSSLAISTIESVLFLSGISDINLHSFNLTILKHYHEIYSNKKEVYLQINITTIGEKLGPSSSMIADSGSALYYYLIRDYAVVKWNSSTPLIAENHNVLMQTYEALPYVSQIFYGPKDTIWALVNPWKPQTCQDFKRNTFPLDKTSPKLKSRIVKLGQR
ncbi:protein yellow-related [Holotrichia oblita]|uniref:Protein yellow-related n=1 Tax=Holotrichia oblita TaxID=644536 RepID=A0ACB9SMW9_HOLOL|nr:protein yellow-related [Holotrichia oblita]